jgi:hypothetical protein
MRPALRARAVVTLALSLALIPGAGCGRKQTAELTPQPAHPAPAPRPAPAPPPEEPATPRLLPEGGDPERLRVEQALDRVDDLVESVRARALTDQQREQVDAVDGFARQAREALAESELERAGILAEKARILIENVERESR